MDTYFPPKRIVFDHKDSVLAKKMDMDLQEFREFYRELFSGAAVFVNDNVLHDVLSTAEIRWGINMITIQYLPYGNNSPKWRLQRVA